MKKEFTLVYKKRGKWYIGWVEEIPGTNSQARTLKGLKENMKEVVVLVLESNKEILNQELGKKFTREPLIISH